MVGFFNSFICFHFHFVAFLIKESFSPTGPALSFATIFLLNYDITSYLLYFYFVSIFYFITYSPSA